MHAIGFREIQRGLRDLGLTRQSRVLALVSLPVLGEVQGGAEAVAGALLAQSGLLLLPAFTYQCQIFPPVGPPANALEYGDHFEQNANADMFRPDLPAHPSLGPVVEALRQAPGAARSAHPLLSFVALGAGAEQVLAAQSRAAPFGPLERLAAVGGDVLLLGVGHTGNVAIHYGEKLAGRKQFIRWALTPAGVVECPNWPGCSAGFDAIAPRIMPFTISRQIGLARAHRLPLPELLQTVEDLLRVDPTALLCPDPDCARCNAVRAAARATPAQ